MKVAASCCFEMAETVSASLAHLCQWSWSRHISARSSSRSGIRPLHPSRRARDFKESSRAAMMDGVSRTRSRETCFWYSRHSGQQSQGSWTRSPVVVATHWAGRGESSHNVTWQRFRGALCEKGTDSDERVNEPPSSYQNGNEPYPQGTWACQRVLSRVCDVWTGMGNEWAGGQRCQT